MAVFFLNQDSPRLRAGYGMGTSTGSATGWTKIMMYISQKVIKVGRPYVCIEYARRK